MTDTLVTLDTQAAGDDRLVDLWLHDLAAHTHDAAVFRAHAARPLAQVALADLQGYADTLAHRAPASRARKLAAVKSLLTFGQRYLAPELHYTVKPISGRSRTR